MFKSLWNRVAGHTPPAADATAAAPPLEPAPVPVAAPVRSASAPSEEPTVEAQLRRALAWRVQVLTDGNPPEVLKSDGPALVELAVRDDEAVVRQTPGAALEALALARDPDTPLHQLSAVFEKDPMLAQALLRLANSAWHRREGDMLTSLPLAVQRIGQRGVQGVLAGSLIQQALCRPGGGYDEQVHRVWSHMQRTAPIARAIATAFRVDPETAFMHALLHDVGKLGVSNAILDKPSALDRGEMDEVRKHTWYTYDILSRVTRFQRFAPLAAAHHERMDGSGYHLGTRGTELSMAARILAVADVCEALSSDRPYRKGMPLAGTLARLDELVAAGQLCPVATEALTGWFAGIHQAPDALADVADSTSMVA